MRLSRFALGACLLGTAVFCFANATYAAPVVQDAPVAEEKEAAPAEPYEVPESVFDIKDGQDGAYYDEAEKTLRAEMSKYIESKPSREHMMGVFDKANATLTAIAKNRIDVADLPEEKRAYAISTYGNMLADSGDFDKIDELIKKFENSENATIKSVVQSLMGKKRFASLVGNEMVMEGLFLDGTELDWKSYRGKVVLVDFWATWCGPCIMEIPNVKAMYEKYHEAGFEVVGYSIDKDVDALKKFEEEEKLPWKTMSREVTLQAKDKEYKNMAAYYGINSIPRMILVDKDGKVIDTNARGEHLTELLKKAFPEVK